MKKILLLFCTFLFINCGNETIVNNCFLGLEFNATIYLNNVEFNDLQVFPSYVSKHNLKGRNVLIIRQKANVYKAFDLACPEKDCSSPMTFDGLKLKCVCSNKEYNYLQGGKPVNGEGCFALEYNVTQTSSTTLLISR